MAAARASAWLWVRVLLFTLLVPGTVIVYAPLWWIITPARVAEGWPPDAMRAPALLLIAAGVSIYAACAWRFAVDGSGTPAVWDAPRRLVTRGLYRWTRSPMYLGVLTALLGEAWLFASRAQLVYAASAFVVFHLAVVLVEEPILRRLFGAEFDAYVKEVPRWVPSPHRHR